MDATDSANVGLEETVEPGETTVEDYFAWYPVWTIDSGLKWLTTVKWVTNTWLHMNGGEHTHTSYRQHFITGEQLTRNTLEGVEYISPL